MEIVSIIPRGTNYLIKPAIQVRSAGGIYIPESANARVSSSKGTVIAVGPDTTFARVMDEIIYTKYTGQELTIRDEKYLLIKEEDIWCKVLGREKVTFPDEEKQQ